MKFKQQSSVNRLTNVVNQKHFDFYTLKFKQIKQAHQVEVEDSNIMN
jgi:hypothetical protein